VSANGDGPAGPRLLVYSQDGLGLGHLRRTSTLINEVLAARPEIGVLTISDSPLGKFFPTAGNHDYLKLPSIRKVGPGDWAPVALPMPFREVISLRRELLRAAALRFRPDVVLVDHMPHGAMGELIPTLEALRPTGARFVLGLRDILDAPEVVRRRWSVEGGYEAVARHYDSVLVYGSREVFDLPTVYGWPAAAASRLTFCGYVSSPPASAADARRVRSRLLGALTAGVPGGKLVVATAGGGADAYPVFSRLLAAVPDILAEHPCGFVMIAGPFMPEESYDDLRRQARGLPVRVYRSVTNVPTYLAAADLVVSMAGYNTTVEILRSGRPGLLVPRRTIGMAPEITGGSPRGKIPGCRSGSHVGAPSPRGTTLPEVGSTPWRFWARTGSDVRGCLTRVHMLRPLVGTTPARKRGIAPRDGRAAPWPSISSTRTLESARTGHPGAGDIRRWRSLKAAGQWGEGKCRSFQVLRSSTWSGCSSTSGRS
jgi:predicted glycosyltransferase